MKRPLLLILLGVLVLVVASVITTRRNSETEERMAPAESSRSAVPEPSKARESEDESALASKTNRALVSAQEENVTGSQNYITHLGDVLGNQNRNKADRLIEKLVNDLGLSAEQKAALEEYFDEKVELAGELMNRNSGVELSQAFEALRILGGKGLADGLQEILSEEQMDEWRQLDAERERRIADSDALRQMADLGEQISVRSDQREALYEHFYQNALEAEQNSSPAKGFGMAMSQFTEGMGIEMSFDHSADKVASDPDVIADFTNEEGEVDYAGLLKKQREESIERKIKELSPFLDEKQLQDYRSHLESQGTIFEGLLNQGPHSSSTVVIPGE
ncbi:hypothetical protein [Roseibacillus ishigakijimensis]|nr:hypothetical protein [Roseibacillus ishigakijimensis]